MTDGQPDAPHIVRVGFREELEKRKQKSLLVLLGFCHNSKEKREYSTKMIKITLFLPDGIEIQNIN